MSAGAVRRLPLLYGAAAVLVGAWGLVLAGPYEQRVLALAGIYAAAALGYQLVFGLAGALSLAQGAFFALGAYATGLLAVHLGWGAWLTLPLAMAAPAAAAALVALPVLRLGSHYFALATLGIAQLVLLAAVNWTELTGGANGVPGVPALGGGTVALVAAWLAAAIALAVHRAFAGRLVGRQLALVRTAPMAAAVVGIDGARLRFRLFVAGAALAGLAGALQAHMIGIVSPEVAQFHVMVAILTIAVVGGRGSAAGTVLAALLLVHLPEWLRALDAWYLVAYGALLLATVVFAPDGLAGLLARLARRPPPEVKPFFEAPPAPPPVSGAILAVDKVSKRFGGLAALDRVSFDVRSGEIVGLIGPNGSGKTTLINIVSGLETPDSGIVRLAGNDILPLPPEARARLGLARGFQTAEPIAGLTLLDSVAVAERDAPTLEFARSRAARRLADVGADPAWLHLPADGAPPLARRLAEIARGLALRPRILLLDEPAAGLDEAERRAVAHTLSRIVKGGAALLIVEHDMRFLLPLANRIACLEAGRLIALGTPAEVRRDARVVAAYLGTAEAAA